MKSKSLLLFIKMSLAIACLSFAIVAFRWGIANLNYFQAASLIDKWSNDRDTLNKSNYNKAIFFIKNALKYHPDHNHYIHTYGRIIHWGISAGIEDKKSYQDVKEIYLEATISRPLWSETWTDLAVLNASLYGLTDETRDYIAKSRTTGHFTEQVMLNVSKIYLNNWNNLNNQDIRNYISIIKESFLKEYRLNDQMQIASYYGKEKLICTFLAASPQVENESLLKISQRYCL